MTSIQPTLQQVPTVELRAWLAAVEQRLGPGCSTARTYQAELRRRLTFTKIPPADNQKAVRHGC